MSVDKQTECLALEVHSGPWVQLETTVPPDWLALEVGESARTIQGLREALSIYYKFGLDPTTEIVTAIKFRRL
jgi:hypothetical protein